MTSLRNQPTFNFLTGEDASTSTAPAPTNKPTTSIPGPSASTTRRLSSSRRTSHLPAPAPTGPGGAPIRATLDNEALRAALNTLQYEFDTYRSDAALARESSAAETRELERRAEAEFRRAGEAEKARDVAVRRLENVAREAREEATKRENEKGALERRVRELGDRVGEGREEIEELKAEVGECRRDAERRERELTGRIEQMLGRVEEVQGELEGERKAAEAATARAKEKEARVAELEEDVLRLKALAGDGDMLGVVKRELGEQVAYVKKLEKSNSDLDRQVKKFTRERKAVEVVEEEKRTLEGKLGLLDDVRRELAESELRRRVLEDERRAWSAYLENEQGQEAGFESPEDMARAFVKEQTERLHLLQRIGEIQPELTVKDEAIAALEQDKSQLQAELKKAKTSGVEPSGAGDSKARARLERQRNLAVKEVEYLRAQLKSLEDETTEFEPGKSDQEATSKTTELESLVDQYKTELQTLHTQLTQLETQPPAPPATDAPKPSLKRPAEDDAVAEDERLGTLRRKARKLTERVSTLETINATLAADLKASASQLSALRESSRVRVLELRSNPTATHEATKLSTLRTLRDENDALLSRLKGSKPAPETVPAAVVAAMETRLAEKEAEIAARDKKTARLKSIWAAKALEFRDAIASTLGWTVTFLPQGKLKLQSVYYPSGVDEETGEEEENFILFDGEKGTMKISGGEQSRFAREIREMVEFWVEGRGEVPCFLAACGLEFWEKSTRAERKG